MRIKQNYRNRTKINIDKWIYKTCDKKKDKTYDFKKQYKTIKFFQREIHSNAFTLEDGLEEQIKFKNQIDIFKESTKPKNPHRLLRGRQKFFYGFERGKFSIKKRAQIKRHPLDLACIAKASDHKQLKTLSLNKCFKHYQ